MQSDQHFYTTYYICRRCGLSAEDSERVAWANQFVDDCECPALYQIMTQCKSVDAIYDRQVQATVLVPFHFVPGGAHSWAVEPGSRRVFDACIEAKDNLIALGIALHGLQDSHSHQGFSGWKEDLNSCYPWYSMASALPNIGHCEMLALPDITSAAWTDPRTGNWIENRIRCLDAAEDVHGIISTCVSSAATWSSISDFLATTFCNPSYDRRIDTLCQHSDLDVDYHKTCDKFHKVPSMMAQFVDCASMHLSRMMHSFVGLPRVSD